MVTFHWRKKNPYSMYNCSLTLRRKWIPAYITPLDLKPNILTPDFLLSLLHTAVK